MTEGIGRRHGGESPCRPLAEGTARSRERDPHDFRHRTPGQALVDRRMLAVHGQEFAAAATQRLHHKVSPRHERLLVGECQPLPRAERRQRRVEPGKPHDCIENDVDPGGSGRVRERCGAEAPFSGPAGRKVVRRWSPEHNEIGGQVEREGVQRLPAAVRRQHCGAKPRRVAPDHLERTPADGSRGAEDGDVLQAATSGKPGPPPAAVTPGGGRGTRRGPSTGWNRAGPAFPRARGGDPTSPSRRTRA